MATYTGAEKSAQEVAASSTVVEKASSLDATTNDVESLSPEDAKITRRATLKTDWRLIPILGSCYAVSTVDRINVSTAKIAGMNKELKFTVGHRYSIALLVFFITYFLFQIPSNLVLRKVGAANWLGFLCFAWGVVTFGSGFSKKWTDIVVCRLLLGLFEAGFFPGSVFLISCWYTRYEVQKRLAIFVSINALANAFGLIVAYGCMQLAGKNNWMGWRWIYIINGAITMFLGILSRVIIVDFPDKVLNSRIPFLTPAEVKAVQNKLQRDREDADYDQLTKQKLINALLKWELWVYAMKFFAVSGAGFAMSFFAPVIISGMGYTAEKAFLMTAPPAITTIPWVMVCSWLSDKYKLRSPFIIIQSLLMIAGLLILLYVEDSGARYGGIFLGLAGAQGNIPSALAWQANNIRGQSLRMVASGLQVGFGAIGGIYASTVFMEQEAPTYKSGLWAITASQLYLIASSILLVMYYRSQNQKAARGLKVLEGMQGFKYTY